MADSIDLCKLFFTDNEKGENFYSSHCRNESMAEVVVPHKIAGSLIVRDLPLLSLSPPLSRAASSVHIREICFKVHFLVWLIEVPHTARWFAMDVQASIVPCLVHS